MKYDLSILHVTPDLIETWIDYKRQHEVIPMQFMSLSSTLMLYHR